MGRACRSDLAAEADRLAPFRRCESAAVAFA
jgi:hypothetical protein